jgi:hypothetical protein
MKISTIKKGLVLAIVSTGVFAAGCELIVDFDRTRILVEIPEASADANVLPTFDGGDAGHQEADANDGAAPEETDAGDAGDASDGSDGAT